MTATKVVLPVAALLFACCTGQVGSTSESMGPEPGAGSGPASSNAVPPAGPGTSPPGATSPPVATNPPTTLPPVTNPPLLQSFVCKAGEDPAPTPLRRLSKNQFINSMTNVFNLGMGYDASVGNNLLKQVASNYALLPEDSAVVPGTGVASALTGFDRTDFVVSQYHGDSYFFVATATANALVNSAGDLANELKAAGSLTAGKGANPCAVTAPPGTDCITAFITQFGRRALRRPLKAEEIASYQATYDATAATDYHEGIAAVVTRFLISPQFLYQVETEGTPVAGHPGLLGLSPYELAARLSYAYADDMPSPNLMKAADDGSLMTDAGFEAQLQLLLHATDSQRNNQSVRRVATLGSSEGPYQGNFTAAEVTVDGFFQQWLRIQTIPEFQYADPLLAKLSDSNGPTYLNGGPAGHHRHFADMLLEAENLYNYEFWVAKGTYAELMTTDKLAYQTADVARVHGLPAWGGGTVPFINWKITDAHPMPSYPAGQRDGLLLRSAFLLSSNSLTNPIKRGVFVQRQILCDQLPSPDPNALPDRSLEPPEQDPTMTTRDRFAEKTQSAVCQACHRLINPTGFALEDFDAIGRPRTTEMVMNTAAKVVGSPAINATATVPMGGETADVKGGSSLMHAIARSPTANACFVRHYFRYVYGRTETAGDGCVLDGLYKAVTTQSMLDMVQQSARQSAFKLHKIGPQ